MHLNTFGKFNVQKAASNLFREASDEDTGEQLQPCKHLPFILSGDRASRAPEEMRRRRSTLQIREQSEVRWGEAQDVI